MKKNLPSKNFITWIAIFIIVLTISNLIDSSNNLGGQKIIFSDFLERVESGQVKQVHIKGSELNGINADGSKFFTYLPDYPELVEILEKNNVAVEAVPLISKSEKIIGGILGWLPFILMIGLWIYLARGASGGKGGGAFGFGKSKAKLLQENKNKVSFDDVAGIDEARQELSEIVDFLKNSQKYIQLGARIPRGCLLIGSPGTGKTLLARAIAGEANVPFYSISGSDFVEMFVGVGASRVRDMFAQAKKSAPCIVFIDEIDAVGRHRGSGVGGGNDEREQTLNQLLVEMDGFAENEGVVIIAATNRPDVLDRALLRPGRFDRQVTVPNPDVSGREQILKVHLRKITAAADIDPKVIARGTPGFAGAELANLINEGALMAARNATGPYANFAALMDGVIAGTIPSETARNFFKDTQDNRQFIRALKVLGSSALSVSPRMAVYDLARVERLFPDPDAIFRNPISEANKLVVLKQIVVQQKNYNDQNLAAGIDDATLRSEVIRKNYEIDRLLGLLEGVDASGGGLNEEAQAQLMDDILAGRK